MDENKNADSVDHNLEEPIGNSGNPSQDQSKAGLDINSTKLNIDGIKTESANSESAINEEVELPEVDTETDQEVDEAITAGVAVVGGVALKLHHLKQFFRNWWRNKKWRYGTFGFVLIALVGLGVYPTTRFSALNLLGFGGQVEVSLYDSESGNPVTSARIIIGDQEAYTALDGRVVLNDVSLGRQELFVSKPGYGDYIERVSIGLGNNRFTDISMDITGVKFVYRVVDFLNGQPVKGALAEISALGSSAVAGDDGIITLAAPFAEGSVTVEFKADKYRNEQIQAAVNDNCNQQEIKMVLSGKHAFISKRDGQFDLYSSDLDGSNQTKILAATGKERQSTLSLLPNLTATHVALVSTRDNMRNEDGYVQSGLYIVDLSSGDYIRADLAESIQLIGWSQDVLIYQTQVSGESGYSTNRNQIKSFTLGNMTGEKLIGSNYFSDVTLANGRIFYAPSQSFKQSEPKEYFYSMNPDGSDILAHIKHTTWQVARTTFEKLVIETVDESADYKGSWYEFDLKTLSTNKLDNQPANFEYWNNNGEFTDSQDRLITAWIDNRDGQTVIITKDNNEKEKTLIKTSGIKSPIRWVGNELIIFRVNRSGEVADYIISINSDKSLKLGDVTDVNGNWSNSYY